MNVSACQGVDSRGVPWTADGGKCQTQSCQLGAEPNVNMTGNAVWCCEDGTFKTSEPDRSDCTEAWVTEVDEMVS